MVDPLAWIIWVLELGQVQTLFGFDVDLVFEVLGGDEAEPQHKEQDDPHSLHPVDQLVAGGVTRD